MGFGVLKAHFSEDQRGCAGDLVFRAKRRGSIRESRFRAVLLQAVARIGVIAGHPPLRFAPYCGDALVGCGVSPKVISEQLGHASVAFTLDVYSHVLPHMQDAAAERVQALLIGPTVP
jgi:integrase